MSTQEIILAVGGGLLVNELCDVSPWAARKIVKWSARLRYGRSTRAEIRAEEHAALIESRPGKLFKLITALGFAVGATGTYVRRETALILSAILIIVSRPRRTPLNQPQTQPLTSRRIRLEGDPMQVFTISGDVRTVVGSNDSGKTSLSPYMLQHLTQQFTQIDSTATDRDSDDA